LIALILNLITKNHTNRLIILMPNSKITVTLQAGNILAFIATLAINSLANTGIFGGKNTGLNQQPPPHFDHVCRIRFRYLGHNLRALSRFPDLSSPA
jgi:hypothetical protein